MKRELNENDFILTHEVLTQVSKLIPGAVHLMAEKLNLSVMDFYKEINYKRITWLQVEFCLFTRCRSMNIDTEKLAAIAILGKI